MKKRSAIIILALATVIITVFVLTHLPKEMTGSMTVCTADGETAEFSYDLRLFNNWFFPSYVKGQVSFNGVEYVDRQSVFKAHHVDSDYLFGLFPKGWWKNELTIPCNMFFYKSNVENIVEGSLNNINVFSVEMNDGIDQIFLGYTDESNKVGSHLSAVFFAGPAHNVDEAKQIAKSFGYKFD